jgi:hypothetical protein
LYYLINMPATNSDDNLSANYPRPPGLILSRRLLTFSLIAVTLVPVSVAATVWLAVPSTPEPHLPVEVTLEPVAWPPEGDDVKLMPGVRLHNPTNENWTNLSIGINKQFYFYSPDPLPAGGDFRVPLAFFKTSGNQPYRPTIVPMRLMTVYAQMPSGKRAILDVKY